MYRQPARRRRSFAGCVSVMPSPGTGAGPCAADCVEHDACVRSRSMAEEACWACAKPIGYQTPFVMMSGGMVHAACAAMEMAS